MLVEGRVRYVSVRRWQGHFLWGEDVICSFKETTMMTTPWRWSYDITQYPFTFLYALFWSYPFTRFVSDASKGGLSVSLIFWMTSCKDLVSDHASDWESSSGGKSLRWFFFATSRKISHSFLVFLIGWSAIWGIIPAIFCPRRGSGPTGFPKISYIYPWAFPF